MCLSLIFLFAKYLISTSRDWPENYRSWWMCKQLAYRRWDPLQGLRLTALPGLPVPSDNESPWLWVLWGPWSIRALSSVHCLSFQMNHLIKMGALLKRCARTGWLTHPSCGVRRKPCVFSSYKVWRATNLQCFWSQCLLFSYFQRGSAEDIIMSATRNRPVDS